MLVKEVLANGNEIRYINVKKDSDIIKSKYFIDNQRNIEYTIRDKLSGYQYKGYKRIYAFQDNYSGVANDKQYFYFNGDMIYLPDDYIKRYDVAINLIEEAYGISYDDVFGENNFAINREVIRDHRMLAGITKEIDMLEGIGTRVTHGDIKISDIINIVLAHFDENPGDYNRDTYEQIIPDFYHVVEQMDELWKGKQKLRVR